MTREEMIIEYYENGRIPFLIKLLDYIKGEKNEHRNNSRMDTIRNNTIHDNGNNSTWANTMHKTINDKEIKRK